MEKTITLSECLARQKIRELELNGKKTKSLKWYISLYDEILTKEGYY